MTQNEAVATHNRRVLFTFPALRCRRALQNGFLKQAILPQSFTVVCSWLFDGARGAC